MVVVLVEYVTKAMTVSPLYTNALLQGLPIGNPFFQNGGSV